MKHQAQLPYIITSMPLDLWCYIFKFITPAPLDKKNFEGLGFVIGRSYLCAQLSMYQSGWGNHKERAHSFFQEVTSINNKEKLHDLVAKQTRVLQGSNPYTLIERDKKHKSNVSNTSLDKYHEIIGFWEEMHTGQAVDFEDKQEIWAIQ